MMNKLINAFLDLDPESKLRLKKLEGKVINIELRPFDFVFHCQIENSNLRLMTGEAANAETTLRGTPLQMMGVMLDKENRQRFFADDLVMEGDAETGQQVVELFDRMEIDWEELFSHFVGDIPAHQTGRLIHGVASWFKEARDSFVQDVSEYVHEEAQWLPTHEALQDFFSEIDVLRMDVDRAEARVNRLKSLQVSD